MATYTDPKTALTAALALVAARFTRYDKAQTLTGVQQTQALTNLGATATGQALVAAADGPAARTAIGAGTSNLAIGTTSTTAKRGDYTPTTSEVRAAGGVTSVTVNGTTLSPTAGVVDLGTVSGSGGATPVVTTDPGAVTQPTIVAPTDGSDTYLLLP